MMKRPYDKQYIAHLLDKFMAGETSLNEEQTLVTYFRTHEVDEEWREYKEMFALFDSGQVEAPYNPPAGDANTGSLLMPPAGGLRGAPLWHLVAGIAAAVFIAFLLWPKSHEEAMTRQEIKPVVAEASQQPAPQPVIEEKKEEVVTEVQPKKQPVKKRRKVHKQQVEPTEETIPAEVMDAYAIVMEPTPDSYADIEAEMLDIRNQGEHIEAMVAAITRPY